MNNSIGMWRNLEEEKEEDVVNHIDRERDKRKEEFILKDLLCLSKCPNVQMNGAWKDTM